MRRPFMVEFTGTPEAGKTTAIKNVANKLITAGYKVVTLQESAEKLPSEIPKGSWNANLWMHLQTTAEILRASYVDADIILLDRGLIDSDFYGKKFLWENEIKEKQNSQRRKQLCQQENQHQTDCAPHRVPPFYNNIGQCE